MSKVYKNFNLTHNFSNAAFGGGGGSRRRRSRSIAKNDGWSDRECRNLGHITAAAGTISGIAAVIPGGQAISLVSGGVSLAGTATYYNFCNN